MSPIIDLQRRLVEVGRIRMGATVPAAGGKTRPARLEKWRLTSRDQPRIIAAAERYGGQVQPWDGHDGQYVLDTDTDNLPIMLLPGQTLTQWFELWSGGGCQRRCDGQTEQLTDSPCMCPDSYDERADQAKEGKACKPTTRLSVLLPEIEGIGCWRLETHGYYAAVELAGTAQLLEEATRRGALLPARLRIDQRKQVKAGKTTQFPVPVIDIDVKIPDMIAAANPAELGYTPIQNPFQVTVSDAIDSVATPRQIETRSNSQAPLGPPAVGFDETPIPVEDLQPGSATVGPDVQGPGLPTEAQPQAGTGEGASTTLEYLANHLLDLADQLGKSNAVMVNAIMKNAETHKTRPDLHEKWLAKQIQAAEDALSAKAAT